VASLGSAVFSLSTDSSKFDQGMVAAEGKTGKLTGALTGASAAVRVMGGVMTGAAVGALGQYAQAAADDEANTMKLQQAINNSGVAFEDYAGSIDAAIKKGQALAFSDDATRNSLASLTESTGSVEEAMKRLPIAMDLARAKNISLESASKLLGKVSDENTKALKKYGIVMEEGATATDVLAKVQQIAGGQAEVYGNSTAGSIAKVKDQVGEFQESIGASLGPAMQFIALGAPMAQGMSIAGGAIGGMWPQVVKTTASLWGMIPAAFAAVVPFWPIIAVVAAVGVAVLALKWAWENNLGDIQGKAEAFMGFLTGWATGFVDIGQSIINGIWAGVSGAWGWVQTQIAGLINMIPEGVRKLLGIASPSTVFMEIGQNIMIGLARGIAQATPAALGVMHDAMATLRGIGGVAGENISRNLDAVTAGGGSIRGFQGGGSANVGDAIVLPGGTVVYATPGLGSVSSGGQTMQIAVNIDGRKVATALAIPQGRDARLAGAAP